MARAKAKDRFTEILVDVVEVVVRGKNGVAEETRFIEERWIPEECLGDKPDGNRNYLYVKKAEDYNEGPTTRSVPVDPEEI